MNGPGRHWKLARDGEMRRGRGKGDEPSGASSPNTRRRRRGIGVRLQDTPFRIIDIRLLQRNTSQEYDAAWLCLLPYQKGEGHDFFCFLFSVPWPLTFRPSCVKTAHEESLSLLPEGVSFSHIFLPLFPRTRHPRLIDPALTSSPRAHSQVYLTGPRRWE